MRRPRALDLFCRAGGVSEGLLRAGFDVTGVDILDCSKAYSRGPGNPERHENPAVFVQADALEYQLDGFDFIWASPPCQAHTILRKLQPGKEYPELIPQTRERLKAAGIPYCIENVPGAPVAASIVLCGSMFGLRTPDGRAELRRHRLFETSWPIALRPACQHGHETITITVTGDRCNSANTPKVICVAGGKAMSGGMMTPQGGRRRAISVTGSTPQTNVERNTLRETFSTDDARAAMGIDWMSMKDLSQAIPPVYAEFLGRMFLGESPVDLLGSGGCQVSLF